jgi:hypothetical protein
VGNGLIEETVSIFVSQQCALCAANQLTVQHVHTFTVKIVYNLPKQLIIIGVNSTANGHAVYMVVT